MGCVTHSYDAARCLVEKCIVYTQHKSGACKEHRTHTCLACERVYQTELYERGTLNTKLCASCRKKKTKVRALNNATD